MPRCARHAPPFRPTRRARSSSASRTCAACGWCSSGAMAKWSPRSRPRWVRRTTCRPARRPPAGWSTSTPRSRPPWNWTINQIMGKLAPALVAGCTVVLKPSEQAPLSAQLLAEFIDESRLPPGVFNLVHGSGPVVGAAMSAHPDIDMLSFTGSTRAGIAVARAAADTVKRVTQELGGKSANIVFADVDLDAAIARGVRACFNNTGQSCSAPTRMLIEESAYPRALEIAAATARAVKVGDPTKPGNHLGPLASRMQFDKVQGCIAAGIAEGARLMVGGPGRPEGLGTGFFVRPTLFSEVHNQMSI